MIFQGPKVREIGSQPILLTLMQFAMVSSDYSLRAAGSHVLPGFTLHDSVFFVCNSEHFDIDSHSRLLVNQSSIVLLLLV